MSNTPPLPPPVPGADSYPIRYSAPKLVKSVLSMLLAAGIVLSCGGGIHPRWVGYCLIALGGFCLLLAIDETRKFFAGSAAVMLTRHGLADSSQKPKMFIPWSDLKKVTLHTLLVNGLPSSRKLILEVRNADGSITKRNIDLNTLKGKPKAIAETVLVWANGARLEDPISLLEDSSAKTGR